jgi:hypothetical protein
VTKRHNIAVLLSIALVAVACRPPIGGSVEPSASSIAGELRPSKEISVTVHLPGAPDVLTAPLAFAAASETIAAAGITLNQVAPTAGEAPFPLVASKSRLQLYFATPSAVLASETARSSLVMIANLQQTTSMTLVAPTGGAATAADLSNTTILVQGMVGDEVPLLALLAREGAENVTAEFPADSSIPLDLTPLFDGTYAAAFLTRYDGLARAQEFISFETGLPVGPDGITVIDLGDTSGVNGLGLWIEESVIADEDFNIAAALILIGLTDGLAFCRDQPAECAAVFEQGGETDRFGDSLAWSVDQFNSSVWPAPKGVLDVSSVSIDRITVNTSILERAIANLPAEIDRIGESWAPSGVALPLE